MTEINFEYILRLYGVHDRITTKIAHLDGEILSGASPALLEKLDELNALANELQDIFEEVLTVWYRRSPKGRVETAITAKEDNIDAQTVNELLGDDKGVKHTVERVPNYRPRKFQASELKRAGVTIIDKSQPHLQCDQCGQTWAPRILHNWLMGDVRLARGYWICPENNCNKPE